MNHVLGQPATAVALNEWGGQHKPFLKLIAPIPEGVPGLVLLADGTPAAAGGIVMGFRRAPEDGILIATAYPKGT